MSRIDRRRFLGTSVALTASLAAPHARAVGKRQISANEKITIALVGCGGMGRYNLELFAGQPSVEVAALCDIDQEQIHKALEVLTKKKRPTEKIQRTKDFRQVVERKDIDAVVIATPDHWHAYIFLAACANGKDIYCEKPLSHNIVEGRAMVDAARRTKRVVQVGTIQRSGQHFKDAVAYVRSGKLGHVSQCRTWITNRTAPEGCGNPPDEDNPPPGVDYGLWLGPAPDRKFNRARFHHTFRFFWDYGNGLCNDWGVHLNDIILWGMNVERPLSVSAVGGKYDLKDSTDTPDTLDVYFEYPGFTHVYTVRSGQTLHGFHGMDYGMEFEGTSGTLTIDRERWFVQHRGDRGAVEQHGGSGQYVEHVQNFLDCIRQRDEKPSSEIEAMHRATTTCHLANIAYKVKRRIYWDADNERCYRGYDPESKQFFIEDMDANAYLLREPRKPWSLTA
jgi:predicted dehydrogenase